MAFWIFMLICNLMIPVVMIWIGMIFQKKPPTKINGWYGYRTSMSRKNMDTWKFAHHYFGKLWMIGGKILLPITILAMFFVLGKETDTVGFFSACVAYAECILMLVPVVMTEIALHRRFDRNGIRKY